MQKASENTHSLLSEDHSLTEPDQPSVAQSEKQCSPPDHAPPASEDAAEIAARRLRLRALQQELAQLKRTPSMQLLARQRIPRLEEAIKHLIASLTASA